MKKILVILFAVITLFLITGCENSVNNSVTFKEDNKHDIMTGLTYKFTGKSEHFAFETGMVYYEGNIRQIFITNFKLIKELNNIDSYFLKLYFNDRSLFTDEQTKIGKEGIKKHLDDLTIGENGKLGEKDENGNIIGESDAFLETTKENFKDSIKLGIKYCYKDNCKNETMKLTYIEE
ncbi:MAG: hypothetical protein PHG18_02520 [Bacilli bacterium]|nr:hypothetical protein [Bacilli bacterium]